MPERVAPDTGFKLGPLVRDVLDSANTYDVDDLTQLVLNRIPSYDRETALYQALRAFVASRRGGFAPPFVPDGTLVPQAPVATPVPPIVPQPARPQLPPISTERRRDLMRLANPPRRPQRSSKVAAIRDDWARRLEQPVSTPTGDKAYGDCTVDDLEFAANRRQKLAEDNLHRAAELRHAIATIKRKGVRCVRDLTADDMRGAA